MDLMDTAAALADLADDIAAENDRAQRKAAIRAQMDAERAKLDALEASGTLRHPGSTKLTFCAQDISRRITLLRSALIEASR